MRIALAASFALAACSGGGGTCPAEQPASCPADVPSYTNDVAPILETSCVTCHSPTGVDPGKPLDTYAHVFDRRGEVLTQVNACRMPPEGEMAPSDDERAIILTWLVCGAPDN